jgi:membrane protein YdbS with pleckstrin-like domain
MALVGDRNEYLLNPSVERRVIRVRVHWAALVLLPRIGRHWGRQSYGIQPVLLPIVGVIVVVYVLSRLVSAVAPGLWLVQSLLWYIAVGVLARFAWELLEWWHWRLIITDKRCMIAWGIIVRRNTMIPITKVTDLTFEQSLFGKLLGYGTLHVESAGKVGGLEIIPFIPMPTEVFNAISELVFGDKKQPHPHMLRPPRRRWRRRGRGGAVSTPDRQFS